jgi:hypothetical protein
VLTIGQALAASEPTVSISGVTITGGVTHSDFFGDDFFAVGGGILVPPGENFAPGATLSVANSVITGNTAAPTSAIDSTLPCPPDITITCINGDLPFAGADGGGINTSGPTTLINTTVSDNRVGGPVASDADGAGINSFEGGLTLGNSTVTGNRASVVAPNGRFADSGGVAIDSGTLQVNASLISNNTASAAVSMPSDIPDGTQGVAGGMHVEGGVSAATISNTTFSGNTASDTNALGDAGASSGGLQIDASVTLSNSVIASNHVRATSLSSGQADAGSGAGEVNGTIANVRFTDNTVDVSSAGGIATAEGGASVFDGGSITNSLISDNSVHVSSPGGSADVRGAGIFVAVSLRLANSTVSGNSGNATGASGSAQGGGIFDAAFPFGPGGPPGGPLTLPNSTITSNMLTGNSGATLQGGGLYIQDEPLTSHNTSITNNVPGQCFGTGC